MPTPLRYRYNRVMDKVLLPLLFSIVLSGYVHAQEWVAYGVDDGLPSDDVAVVYAEGGAVWVGTEQGLARFNGSTWEAYSVTDGLPGEHIVSVTGNEEGAVYAGAVTGVAAFDGNEWSPLPPPRGEVLVLAYGRGTVWAGTSEGLFRLREDAQEWDEKAPALGGGYPVVDLAFTADEAVLWAARSHVGVEEWRAAAEGLAHFYTYARENIDLCLEDVTALDVSAEGVLHVSYFDGCEASAKPESHLTVQARPRRMARYDGSTWTRGDAARAALGILGGAVEPLTEGGGTASERVLSPRAGEEQKPERPTAAQLGLQKGQLDTRPSYVPARGSGGPDAFGYTWADSNDPDGPAFEDLFVDYGGTLATLTQAAGCEYGPYDEGYADIPLPFWFEYYGATYDVVRVWYNGFISFEGAEPYDGCTYDNDPIPTPAPPNNAVFPLWDDFDGSEWNGNGRDIYYRQLSSGRFIMQWDVELEADGSPNIFQVILSPDGSIKFQYRYLEGTAFSYSIGMENADGTDGLEIATGSGYATDGLAVLISPPRDEPPPATPSFNASVLATPQGVVYAGFRPEDEGGGGLAYTTDGVTWDVITSAASGLPSDDIRAVATDHDGRVWVGTAAGVAAYSPALAAPSGLRPQAEAKDADISPRLRWAGVPGASGYEVEMEFGDGGGGVSASAVSPAYDVWVGSGRSVSWRVRAVSGYGAGPWSAYHAFTTGDRAWAGGIIPCDPVRAMAPAGSDALWIGCGEGDMSVNRLFYLRGDQVTEMSNLTAPIDGLLATSTRAYPSTSGYRIFNDVVPGGLYTCDHASGLCEAVADVLLDMVSEGDTVNAVVGHETDNRETCPDDPIPGWDWYDVTQWVEGYGNVIEMRDHSVECHDDIAIGEPLFFQNRWDHTVIGGGFVFVPDENYDSVVEVYDSEGHHSTIEQGSNMATTPVEWVDERLFASVGSYSDGYGLVYFALENGEWIEHSTGLSSSPYSSFYSSFRARVEAGALHILYSDSLIVEDGGGWNTYTSAEAFGTTSDAAPALTGFDLDVSGNLWLGSQGSGVAVFDGASWTRYGTGGDVLPSPDVVGIVATDDGSVWIGTSEGVTRTTASPVAVPAEEAPGALNGYALHPLYPNPSRGRTTIPFELPVSGVVTVEVFDLLGRRVATPFAGPLPAGLHHVVWEEEGLASGVYIVRLMGGTGQVTQKVSLLR